MKNLSLVLLLFLGFSCANDHRAKKPDNLIPKDQMVSILYDIYILNAAKGTHKNILEEDGIYPQKYVFTKYKIDSLQFAQSNDYYGYDIAIYEEIIDKVNARVVADKQLYQDRIDEEVKLRQREKESLRDLSEKTNKKLVKAEIKRTTDSL